MLCMSAWKSYYCIDLWINLIMCKKSDRLSEKRVAGCQGVGKDDITSLLIKLNKIYHILKNHLTFNLKMLLNLIF